MSVAIYLHDLSGGGVERQSLIIAEEFRRHGVDVTLVVHQLRGQLLDQVPAGLRVIDLGSSRTLHDVPRLARFLRREEPDILVANVDLNNVAALLAKGLAFSRTKIVICQHNPISAGYLGSGELGVPVCWTVVQAARPADRPCGRGFLRRRRGTGQLAVGAEGPGADHQQSGRWPRFPGPVRRGHPRIPGSTSRTGRYS